MVQTPNLCLPASAKLMAALGISIALFTASCYQGDTDTAGDSGGPRIHDDVAPSPELPLLGDSTEQLKAWNLQLDQARHSLQLGALEEAQQGLATLKEMPIELSPEQFSQLRAMESQLNQALEAQSTQLQLEEFALASEFVRLGKFDEALVAIDSLLGDNPSEGLQGRALDLKSFITDYRADAERISQAMQMLAHDERADVLAAQNILFEHPEAALSLLEQSSRARNETLVRNSLEMLRKLDRPEVTLPIMVDVLRRPEQQPNWPDARGEIVLAQAAGAGEPLLDLALSTELPEQRIAALLCLSRIVDPPQRCVVELLPLLNAKEPELAAALAALGRAVHVHRQHDVVTRRGLDFAITPEQSQRLDALPSRLSQLIAGEGQEPGDDVVRAATKLGILMRVFPARPLRRVKVLGFAAEMNDSRAATVVDGVWNTVDPRLMWRYPVNKTGSIVLDLGEARTISGVRIWNLNEPGGMHRGWKDVKIFVGNAPAELVSPATTGFLPAAPGVVDAPDYSVTVPLDFIQARYIRLEAETLWRADQHAGLTEIQVLGF